MSAPEFDGDRALEFLQATYGNLPGYVQICYTGNWTGRFFRADELDKAVDYAQSCDELSPAGIYFRATTLRAIPGEGKRGGVEDTLAVPFMWGDVDYGTEGHKKGEALPPTLDDAKAVIHEAGLGEPTLLIHSGGGLYPVWALDQAVAREDAERLSEWTQEALLRASEARGWTYGTGVKDLARVLRLPGSVNRKTANHRQCKVIGASYELISPDAIPEPPKVERVAVSVNRSIPLPPKRTTEELAGRKRGPLDVLAELVTWGEVLEPAGWTLVEIESDGSELWLRPGGDASSRYSARAFPHNLVCHSESAGLPVGAGQRLTKGRVYAYLWYRGDVSEAAKALLRGDNPAGLASHVLDEVKAECSHPTERGFDGIAPPPEVDDGRPRAVSGVSTPPAPPRGSGAPSEPPTPAPGDSRPPRVQPGQAGPTTSHRLRLVKASEVKAEIAQWLWVDSNDFGRIPRGELSIAAGRGNVGKSPFALWLAAQLSRGELSGDLHGEPRDVLIYASEDSYAHTVRPRLEAAGADLERVHFIAGTATDNDPELPLNWSADLPLICEALETLNVALLIIDPLFDVYGKGIDANKSQDVRRALTPLVAMAHKTGTAVLGLAHFRKGTSDNIGDMLSSSHGLRDIARAVIAFVMDKEGQRFLGQDKNNLGRAGDDVPTLTYEMESVYVEIDRRPVSQPVFKITGTTDVTLGDVLSAPKETSTGDFPPELDWLFELVAKGRPYPIHISRCREEATALKLEFSWDWISKKARKTKMFKTWQERGAVATWVMGLSDAGEQRAAELFGPAPKVGGGYEPRARA